MSGKLKAAILFSCVFALSAQGIEKCQLHLFKILKRLPPESTRTYPTANPKVVNRLDSSSPELAPLLHPQFRANVYENGPLGFSVIGTDDFQKLINKTNGKGFWVLYSPADESNNNPVGHTSVSINDTYFTGQYAMTSLKKANARLEKNPYIVAQFLELSDEGNAVLEKFMHDRVWFYHQKHPDYRSNYVTLPFSRDSATECGENCVSSNLGFLEQKWIDKRPELAKVRDELGGMMVSEVPNRQVFFSTKSPAYRGTVIITHKPEEAKHWISKGDFNISHTGKQLLFDGLPQPITEER